MSAMARSQTFDPDVGNGSDQNANAGRDPVAGAEEKISMVEV
jgi:hypothetical protein